LSASISREGSGREHAYGSAAREVKDLETARPVKEKASRWWRWTTRTVVIVMVVVATSTALTVWGPKNSTALTAFWSEKGEASGSLNIAILVFREGLECILVLAALTASFKGREAKYHRPVIGGVLVGILAHHLGIDSKWKRRRF
jgi:hypothetical protein